MDNNNERSTALKIIDHCLRYTALILVFCVGMILGMFLFGNIFCYADTADCFTVPRVTGASADVLRAQGVSVGTNTVSSNTYPVYVGIYPSTWAGESDTAALYTSDGRIYAVVFSTTTSGGSSGTGVLRSAYNTTTGSPNYGSASATNNNVSPAETVSGSFADVNICSSSTFSTSYTIFNSRTDAIQAIYDYDNPSEPETSIPIITLQPGNLYYLYHTGDLSFRATSIFRAYSKANSPFWYESRGYTTASSLPSTSETSANVDSSSFTLFSFQPYGNKNLLGRSKTGEQYLTFSGTNYVVIYVPLYAYFDSTMGPESVNHIITLHNVTGLKGLRAYSLDASVELTDVSWTGKDFSISSEYNPQAAYEADSEALTSSSPAIVWTQDGSPSDGPSYAGDSEPPTAGSVFDQFEELLSDLISRIESLLLAPVDIIQRLISAGIQFMTSLSYIWQWLPSPLMAVIRDVLYILIIIGALKTLWK